MPSPTPSQIDYAFKLCDRLADAGHHKAKGLRLRVESATTFGAVSAVIGEANRLLAELID